MESDHETYRMKARLLVVISSPCCTSLALQRTISDNEESFPKPSIQTARERFNVDDSPTSVNTIEEARLAYFQLKEILSLKGFNLIELTSNRDE